MLRGVVSMGLAGLLIVGAANARAATQPDPLEPLNRGVFQFNNWIVDHVMQPAGAWGSANLPDDVRAAALNAYSNLSEPEFILTNLFQGNFRDAFISTERIVVNTTAGLAGIYDPATRWGLVARRPEFGEAVCSLHVPPGAYLQVPLVGLRGGGTLRLEHRLDLARRGRCGDRHIGRRRADAAFDGVRGRSDDRPLQSAAKPILRIPGNELRHLRRSDRVPGHRLEHVWNAGESAVGHHALLCDPAAVDR